MFPTTPGADTKKIFYLLINGNYWLVFLLKSAERMIKYIDKNLFLEDIQIIIFIRLPYYTLNILLSIKKIKVLNVSNYLKP